MSEPIEVIAALERLEGVTEAFLEESTTVALIKSHPPQERDHLRKVMWLTFQRGYMAGHIDGTNSVTKSATDKIAAIRDKI